MAIPVIVDHDTDYEEVILQQLFVDLWHTLQQIEFIQRSRQNSQQNPTRVSATLPVNNYRRCSQETGERFENDHTNPGFVNLAVALSSGSIFQAEQRRRIRPIGSEAAACEDTKSVKVSISVEVTHKNRAQQEKSLQPKSENTLKSESVFSKLVPSAPLSFSLWTAVICVVGWHLLRNK